MPPPARGLAPFAVVLTVGPAAAAASSSSDLVLSPETVARIRRKMDVATNPVLKSFLAGSISATCRSVSCSLPM